MTKTILIVDDHALFRSGLHMVLAAELADITICEASSIGEALRSAPQMPDLILLDIELNGLNGLDGIAVLKRTWPQTQIVMLSSDTSSCSAHLALMRGARAFVTKAETAQNIIQLVQTLLGQDLQAPDHATFSKRYVPESSAQLTSRQNEVLDLLAQGLSNKLIARQLNCAENTVRGHVQAILIFFKATSRQEAVYAAKQQGIIH